MMLKIALHMARKDYEQRATKQASDIAKQKEGDMSKPLEERTYKGCKANTFMNGEDCRTTPVGLHDCQDCLDAQCQ